MRTNLSTNPIAIVFDAPALLHRGAESALVLRFSGARIKMKKERRFFWAREQTFQMQQLKLRSLLITSLGIFAFAACAETSDISESTSAARPTGSEQGTSPGPETRPERPQPSPACEGARERVHGCFDRLDAQCGADAAAARQCADQLAQVCRPLGEQLRHCMENAPDPRRCDSLRTQVEGCRARGARCETLADQASACFEPCTDMADRARAACEGERPDRRRAVCGHLHQALRACVGPREAPQGQGRPEGMSEGGRPGAGGRDAMGPGGDVAQGERGPRGGDGSDAGMGPQRPQLPERCRPIARVLHRMCEREGPPEGAPEGRPQGERPTDGEGRPPRGGR